MLNIELSDTAGELSAPTTIPGGIIARFMELRGRRIIEVGGALWHSVEMGFFMSCPYHHRLSPDREELERMLWQVKAVGMRFPSLSCPGLPSGVYLYKKKSYGFRSIHPSYRQKVHKGLNCLEVREVDPPELLVQGLRLNLDTMSRQGRYDSEFGDPPKWNRLVEAIRRIQGISAVGAFLGDRLTGYVILCRENRVLHILHQMSRTEDLKCYPNHTLTYEVTRRAAEDPDIDLICYGLESLVHGPGLHNYKLDFGYEFSQHNSIVVLHPWVAWLSNNRSRAFLRGIRKLRPRDQRLERVETVLRTTALSEQQLLSKG